MIATLVLLAAVAAPPPDNPLQPLEFLVGHCWSGEFPNGMGKDTHCFESMYGGKFIRDKHVLHGKQGDYSGETIYAFDPKQKKILFWYFSSDGDLDNGSVSPAADGLEFPEHTLMQPRELVMRTHWKRNGGDRYIALNERKEGENWKVEWQVEYVRDEVRNRAK